MSVKNLSEPKSNETKVNLKNNDKIKNKINNNENLN